ncbi:MAG: sensor histidine kinase [Rhodoferax sp.]|nr:sensor histidine kinase [Rhodoferax sp.]
MRGLLLGLFLLLLSPLMRAETQPLITFDQGQLTVLRDKSKQLTLAHARAAHEQGQFKPLTANLGLGYVPDAVWLRLAIAQHHPEARWLEVMPPYLDDIRLFHIRPDGQVDERRSGDRLPQSVKEEPYRGHLFKLDFQPGDHEIFIRLQTTSTLVAIVKLWQPRAFEQHLRSSYFGFGLYFSLILAVLLFNAVNWLVARRWIFLVYVGYLLINTVQWHTTNGFTAEFLLPERPDLVNLALGLLISLGAAMAWLFFMMILELKQYHPFLYRFSQFGIVVSLVTFIATLLGHYQTFMTILLLTGIVSLLTVPWPMWRLWKTGEIWARLLALAYFLYASLLLINILGNLAILPYSEWSFRAGMASNIAHILFLHFAILLHYRRVENDHAEALIKSELVERQLVLEQAYRGEQDKLLRMMSHEIRTPIALIDSARQVLQALDEDRGDPPAPERQQRYGTIQRAVSRLGALMDMALTREKDIPEVWQMVMVPIDPQALTHSVISMLDPTVAMRVQVIADPDLPLLQGDERLLRIALLNLLENAGKYAPGESPIHVTLKPCHKEGVPGLGWHFEDSGPGVPPGMEERIFEKYTRVSESSGTAGLGLGLYLVRHIVEHHGGSISAESGRSTGAAFIVWLPAANTK